MARDQAVGHFIALAIGTDHVGPVLKAPIDIGADAGHCNACLQEVAILEEESPA